MANQNQKTYSLKDITMEIVLECKHNVSYANAPAYLSSFFEKMGLLDEWKTIRGNKRKYSFCRKDADLVKKILIQKSKLTNDDRHKKSSVDSRFLYDVCNDIAIMLTRDKKPEEIEVVKGKLQSYMTKMDTSYSYAPQLAEESIRVLISKATAGPGYYLKSRDKYIWIQQLMDEIGNLVDRWQLIYDTMSKLRENDLHEEILICFNESSDHYDTFAPYVDEELEKNTYYRELKAQKTQLSKELEMLTSTHIANLHYTQPIDVKHKNIDTAGVDAQFPTQIGKYIEITQKIDEVNKRMNKITEDYLRSYIQHVPPEQLTAVKEFYLPPAEVLIERAIAIIDDPIYPQED